MQAYRVLYCIRSTFKTPNVELMNIDFTPILGNGKPFGGKFPSPELALAAAKRRFPGLRNSLAVEPLR